MVKLLLLRRWSWSRRSRKPPDAVAEHHDRDDHGGKRIPWVFVPEIHRRLPEGIQDTPHRALKDTLPAIEWLARLLPFDRNRHHRWCQVSGGPRPLQDAAHVEPIRGDRGARAVDPGIQRSRPAAGGRSVRRSAVRFPTVASRAHRKRRCPELVLQAVGIVGHLLGRVHAAAEQPTEPRHNLLPLEPLTPRRVLRAADVLDHDEVAQAQDLADWSRHPLLIADPAVFRMCAKMRGCETTLGAAFRLRWDGLRAPLPTSREHLAVAVLDDKLLVVGGRWGDAGNLTTLETYDPATGRWTRGRDMPTPRSGLTAGALAGHLHVTGGEPLSSGDVFAEQRCTTRSSTLDGGRRSADAAPWLASTVLGERW